MPEETATTETTTTETVPTSMIGEDGNFIKDWHKSLADETLHEDKTLATIKNLDSLAKSYVHVRKQVPLDKIAIPNDSTSDAEWENWHNAGGRPSTAVDYAITRPDNFPEEHWKDERANKWMERFHKAGLNPKQVTYLFGEHSADILEDIKVYNDAITDNRQQIKDGLYKDWGNAYESLKHQGNYAVEKGTGGDAEFKTRLATKFGDDPDFIRFCSNIGGKFAEHGDIVESHVSTPGDLQEQITKIQSDPKYSNKLKSIRQPLIDKVMRLREELNKSTNR